MLVDFDAISDIRQVRHISDRPRTSMTFRHNALVRHCPLVCGIIFTGPIHALYIGGDVRNDKGMSSALDLVPKHSRRSIVDCPALPSVASFWAQVNVF